MQDADDRRGRIIDSLEAARSLFAPGFRQARNERLQVAHLDRTDRLIGYRIRYAPEGKPIDLSIRTIIADAVTLGTIGLIIAHNHISGDPEPTATDIEATRSLVQVARPIGIIVRDHLVFGGKGFVSFRLSGLL